MKTGYYNKRYPGTLKGGTRVAQLKNPPATGFAAEQLAGFDKPSVDWKKNPNRSYNDDLSRGNVGSNKI